MIYRDIKVVSSTLDSSSAVNRGYFGRTIVIARDIYAVESYRGFYNGNAFLYWTEFSVDTKGLSANMVGAASSWGFYFLW